MSKRSRVARLPMHKKKDKQVFAHTAVAGKSINVYNKNGRGGTYL